MKDAVKFVQDVHYVAENFLRDPWAKQAETLTTREIEMEHLQVILARETAPRFFCGIKASDQTPVWSHEARFAKQLQYIHADTWQHVLEHKGHVTLAMWAGIKQ